MTVNKLTNPPTPQELINKTNEIIDNLGSGSGITLQDVLTSLYPVGAIWASATHSSSCPLASLFTSTWTLVSSTVITSVGATTSTAEAVSIKGDGTQLGFKNLSRTGTGLTRYGSTYGVMLNTTGSWTNADIMGINTDATKSGLTGSVTIPALTPSTTSQTIYIWQRTA